MSGQFSPGTRPPLPGAYFDFEVAQPQPVLVNTLGVAAIPFTHSWGPANTVVQLDSWADFLAYFGEGAETAPSYSPGYKAVRMAFTGEGLPGRGGAARVLAYRIVGSTGASSTLTIQNTTPADALTITAVYPGAFGNSISYTNAANQLNPSTQSDFTLLVSGLPTESYTYNKTDIAGLAAQINAGSRWVTATSVLSGTALGTQTSSVSLAAGVDGSSLVSGDWTAAFAAFGTQRFSVFAPFDLEDSSLLASLATWAINANIAGKRFTTVIGGPTNDSAATAAARSSAMSVTNPAAGGDPNFLNIGVGTYSDAVLGTLNTAQLAPRLAGIVAQRGDSAGLSYARLADLTIISGPSDQDILSSITGGWMALGRDSNADAPTRFVKGVTTFTLQADAHRPFKVYSQPKFVVTMQDIERTITQWAETQVVGLLPVDDNTVNYVLGWVKSYFKDLENGKVIQDGWTVQLDPGVARSSVDDFIPLLYSVKFTRDTEQVLNRVIVG